MTAFMTEQPVANDTKLRAMSLVKTGFAFAIGRFGAALSASWALLVLVIGVEGWNLYTLPPITAEQAANDLSASSAFYVHIFLYLALTMLIWVPIAVAQYRTYFEGPIKLHLSFGPTEWRYVGANVVLLIVGIAIGIAAFIGFVFALIAVMAYGQATGVDIQAFSAALSGGGDLSGFRFGFILVFFAVIGALILALLVAVLWVTARFFTLFPDVVRNKRLSLSDNMRVTKGHAWTIAWALILTTFAVFVPYLALQYAISATIGGELGQYFSYLFNGPGEEPLSHSLVPALIVAAFSQLMTFFITLWSVGMAARAHEILFADQPTDGRIEPTMS